MRIFQIFDFLKIINFYYLSIISKIKTIIIDVINKRFRSTLLRFFTRII